MDGTGASAADILAYAIAFAVLGGLAVAFGVRWSGGRSDSLVDDPKLPDRFDAQERDYRADSYRRGVRGILIFGVVLLLAAAVLAVATL